MTLGTMVGLDDWLETRCREVEAAGSDLALVVGEVNHRLEQARDGHLSRRRVVTEVHLGQAETVCRVLHDVQVSIQNALFDCEHEMRELREREVSQMELLIDGERLVRQYRFLRRRARVIDGLLAYLPAVCAAAQTCMEHLRKLADGGILEQAILVPDCGFALVAIDQLQEGAPTRIPGEE